MWLGVPQNTTAFTFQFYGGTTSVLSIDGTGNLFTNANGTFGTATFINGILNPPTFTTMSTGSRITLWTSESSTSANWAIGMGSNQMWFGVPQNVSTQSFNFYGGTTLVTTIDGTGNFTTAGAVTANMFISPNITNNPPSFNTTSSGTKLLMFNQTTSTSTNYAIGATAFQVWFSVPTNTTNYGFQFYGGTTSVATIDGTGNLFTSGYLFPTSPALNTPTFNTISSGTRLILWNVPTSSSANMAIGVSTNIVWFGLPNNIPTQSFQFFGGTTNVATIDGVGNFYAAGYGGFGNSLTIAGGVVISNQMITWPNVGNAWPTFNTTSIGTRILLWSQTDSSNTNYAIGMSGGTVWFSVPQANNGSYNWQFVGGTTSICTIDTFGNLTTSGLLKANQLNVGNAALGQTTTLNLITYGNITLTYGSIYCSTGTLNFNIPYNNTGTTFTFWANGQNVASINGTGNIFAQYTVNGTAFNTYSDLRLKENIVDARNYLSDINKLRVVKYNLKKCGSRHIGLIAQEIETVFPGLIENTDKTYNDVENIKLIKYSVLNVMMLKAIQELSTQLSEERASRSEQSDKLQKLEQMYNEQADKMEQLQKMVIELRVHS